MKHFGILIGAALCWSCAAQEIVSIPLWKESVPNALGSSAKDIPGLRYYPAKASASTGAAILICPGGGYFSLNQRSGTNYASWFSEQGVASFVLDYRLGGTNGYRWPIPFDDARRAMRLIRSRASEF